MNRRLLSKVVASIDWPWWQLQLVLAFDFPGVVRRATCSALGVSIQ